MSRWLFQTETTFIQNGSLLRQRVQLILLRKDASKFLNQIIKKQRIGFSRAGLGMQDPKDKSRVIQ